MRMMGSLNEDGRISGSHGGVERLAVRNIGSFSLKYADSTFLRNAGNQSNL
jgi:hypothetical protein